MSNTTTVITAQPGYFVLEPYCDEASQYAGFHRYAVLAWKVLDASNGGDAYSITIPVTFAAELTDGDLCGMPVQHPDGTIYLFKNGCESWFPCSADWFIELSQGADNA